MVAGVIGEKSMKLSIALLLVVSLLVGCRPAGEPMYPVTGTVRYRGKPLPLGAVFFVPEKGPMSGPASIDSQGRYQLEAVAGQHAVGVFAMPPRTGGRPDPRAEGGMDWSKAPPVKSLIPAKYNRYDTSGVSVTVEAKATNAIDLNLD